MRQVPPLDFGALKDFPPEVRDALYDLVSDLQGVQLMGDGKDFVLQSPPPQLATERRD